MDLILIQSQEHPLLPIAELKAVIECENMDVKINKVCEGLVLLNSIKEENIINYYQTLVKRLGYTHEVHELISIFNYDDLEEEIKAINWVDYLEESFAVRVKRFNTDIDTVDTEKKIGSLILNELDNIKVNLNKPKSYIRVIINNNKFYVAIRRFILDKKHFENIKPHKRPFFYPGSMSPKLARCMVNLSRVKNNDLLLDPFCGTGGILIEAGMIGAKVIGSDINWKMKNGTGINLEYCNIKDYKVYHLDVRDLEMFERVNAVVTDPPYGISTSTGDIDGDEIYGEFFKSIYKNMADNAFLCMASPHYVDLNFYINQFGFELVEQYHIKMHRSLTRVISVIKKSNFP